MSLALLAVQPIAYAGPVPSQLTRTSITRTPMPEMMGKSRKQRRATAAEASKAAVVDESYDSGVQLETPAPTLASDMPPLTDRIVPTATSKLPPLTGSKQARSVEAKAELASRTMWNPNGLDVSALPGPLKSQFVDSYLSKSPTYLDGSMPGDVGFDPWALVALASPTAATDAFARSASDRDAKMMAMGEEEQRTALAWMRESELKHARLAMLAAAGWPMAELNAGSFLKEIGTGGRAPSLFNGHLLEFSPFVLLAFAPIAYLEMQNKGKLVGGDYGFDPMGLSGEQRPYGAFPFDAFMAKKTPIDSLPGPLANLKDAEAMQLAEIKNGRLAMMAITGMAVQEFIWKIPVVEQTPFFFGR